MPDKSKDTGFLRNLIAYDESGNVTIPGTLSVSGGTPVVTQTSLGTYLSTNTYATESYVTTAVANLVAAAPGTLDTLNELATALGNDASFATSVTTSLAGKLSLTGGVLTGGLTATGFIANGTGASPVLLTLTSGNPNCDITLQSSASSALVRLRNGSDDFQIHTNGVQRVTVSSAGLTTLQKDVSASTTELLRLKNGYNDTSTGIRMAWGFSSLNGAYLDVVTDSGGSKSMILYLSSANAAPSQVLQIVGSTGAVTANGSITAGSFITPATGSAGSTTWSLLHDQYTVGDFGIYTPSASRIYINAAGSVGFGTTSPQHKIHVNGGNIYSTDTIFARNLKPEAWAGPAAGSPTAASIPQGYSTINISSPCDNNWRVLLSNLQDTKVFMWVSLGDAASKNMASYTWQMTSPSYGVANFAQLSYMTGGWNAGGFEFTYDGGGGNYRLLVRCTSYYNSANTAYGTIYFLRLE